MYLDADQIDDPPDGCYVDATTSPWSQHYQMFTYVNEEFYDLLVNNFHVDIDRIGIIG
jgi:S-formylglutathione hydrolase